MVRFSPKPWLEPIDNYEAIGSGDSLAKLVLRQQSRAPHFENKSFSDLPLKYNIWLAALTINEIKAFEIYSGGSTRVVTIDEDGYKPLTNNELSKYYNSFLEGIANMFKSYGVNKEVVGIFSEIITKDPTTFYNNLADGDLTEPLYATWICINFQVSL